MEMAERRLHYTANIDELLGIWCVFIVDMLISLHPHIKLFCTIYMHQFEWLSEIRGYILKFASERAVLPQGGLPILMEAMESFY